MYIAGYHNVTLLDFPGKVAALCFFQGCQLRCPYCHNPGMVLPGFFKKEAEINKTTEGFFNYLDRRKGLLDGVVVSGGEPLMQDGLMQFLRKLKENGFLVKLDTNGLLPQRLAEVIQNELVDHVALDYKNCLDGWAETTGVKNLQAAENNYLAWQQSLDILNCFGVDYELRTTVVKELHPRHYLYQMANDLRRLNLKPATTWFLQRFQNKPAVLADYEPFYNNKKSLTAYSPGEMILLADYIKSSTAEVRLRNVS